MCHTDFTKSFFTDYSLNLGIFFKTNLKKYIETVTTSFKERPIKSPRNPPTETKRSLKVNKSLSSVPFMKYFKALTLSLVSFLSNLVFTT